MKYFANILIILIFLFLNSCSNDKKKIDIIEEEDIELQMIDSYKEGIKALEDGDVLFAAKKFNEAELVYPQSDWAPKSALMSAYSYYIQDYYGDAVFELNRFIKTYPKDLRLSYAHFLLGMCYYEQIIDEKKDLGPILKAKEKFNYILKNYPDTDFALDAQFKLDLINDISASKEMYIGKHYVKKQKWIPAINRFQIIVKNYDTTVYVEEALFRLVEIYYLLGLTDESQKYAKLLGYNYLSSRWYKESYRIFNKNYKSPREKIKEKKRNFIIRKFKSIFN
ncbi:MAG TPA: outer membrane protein assembly factor BamD [Candidatus Pelagibacter sp.]|nr:outer membrane protein assembly factor BamD [Candidatus Pelagibacter sp.]